jgi:hypothetical protein
MSTKAMLEARFELNRIDSKQPNSIRLRYKSTTDLMKYQENGNVGIEAEMVLLDVCPLQVLKAANPAICTCFLQVLEELQVLSIFKRSMDSFMKHFSKLAENMTFCKGAGYGTTHYPRHERNAHRVI